MATPSDTSSVAARICDAQFRDPMTIVYSFTRHPQDMRRTCRFMVECYNHGCYLEGGQTYPYVATTTIATAAATQQHQEQEVHCAPILLQNVPHVESVKAVSYQTTEEEGERRGSSESCCWKILYRTLYIVDIPTCGAHKQKRANTAKAAAATAGGGSSVFAMPANHLSAFARLEANGNEQNVRTKRKRTNGLQQHMEELSLPDSVTEVHLARCQQIKTLGSFDNRERRYFLGNPSGGMSELISGRNGRMCAYLKTATIEDMPELYAFADNIFCLCPNLTVITLRHCPRLYTIGHNFMSDCPQLATVTLEELPELQKVGFNWLRGCALTQLHFTGLPRLKQVNSCLMSDCQKLTKVAITDLPEFEALGSWCLDSCRNLTFVRIADLPSLRKIGTDFPHNCIALTCIEIENLPALTKVEHGWMQGCICLESVSICELPKLREVGSRFLADCTSLQKVHFSDLPCLTEVGPEWLANCLALEEVEIHSLISLQETGGNLMHGCSGLKRVALHHLPSLERIGGNTFAGEEMRSLELIVLLELPNLMRIYNHFCADTPSISLKDVVLKDLPLLGTIDQGAFRDAKNLRRMTLTNLPELTCIARDFCSGCTALELVTFSELPKLTDLQDVGLFAEVTMVPKKSLLLPHHDDHPDPAWKQLDSKFVVEGPPMPHGICDCYWRELDQPLTGPVVVRPQEDGEEERRQRLMRESGGSSSMDELYCRIHVGENCPWKLVSTMLARKEKEVNQARVEELSHLAVAAAAVDLS